MVNALRARFEADIAEADATINIYLTLNTMMFKIFESF